MIAIAALTALLGWQGAQAAGERITIATPSGATLVGRYMNAGPGTPGVLFFPMCRADAMDGWVPVAERLLAAGVSSLSISYRGYGESTAQGSGDQRVNDADAAFAYLRSRVGGDANVAVAGSSCGVFMSLTTASRHPDRLRAVVAVTGPHMPSHVTFLKQTPGLAVFSGASASDGPAPGWARELKEASTNEGSRLVLPDTPGHGTDIFRVNPGFAREIAEWLVGRLSRT